MSYSFSYLHPLKRKLSDEYHDIKKKYEDLSKRRKQITEDLDAFEKIKKELEEIFDKKDEQLKSETKDVIVSTIKYKSCKFIKGEYDTCECKDPCGWKGPFASYISSHFNNLQDLGDLNREITSYLKLVAEIRYKRYFHVVYNENNNAKHIVFSKN